MDKFFHNLFGLALFLVVAVAFALLVSVPPTVAAPPAMSNVKVMDYIQMNDFVFYRLLLKDDTQCVVIIKGTPTVTCDWKSK